MSKPKRTLDASALLGLGRTGRTIRKAQAMHLGLNLGDMLPWFLQTAFRMHTLICGASGRGKSVLTALIAFALAKAGNGLVFLDPHGTTAKTILQMCMRVPFLADRVHWFSVNDGFGYNLLEPIPGITESARIDMTMQTFLRVWGHDDFSQTPTLERWLRLGLLVLYRCELTLAEAPFLFSMSDNQARSSILNRARDLGIPAEFMADWDWFEGLPHRQQSDQMLSSYNRIFKLTFDQHSRRILAQTGPRSLSIMRGMEEGHIMLFDLSTHYSAEVARLIGISAASEVAYLAKLRADDGTARPVYCFIEEFSQLANKAVAEALPQTRKYNVFFALVTQFLQQLERSDPDLLESALTNCQLKICFGGMTYANCQIMTDALFSGQLNLLEPKLWRTYFEPIQRWHEMITRTRGGSLTTTRSRSNSTSRSHTNGYSDQEGESIRYPNTPFGEATRTYQAGGSIQNSVTDGTTSTEGVAESETESWSESSSQQLLTFYRRSQEVSQVWGLEEQRYKVTALLQNLPVATAAIKYGADPTQVVGIKYVAPPRIRPGGEAAFLERINDRPFIQSPDEMERQMQDRHQAILGRGTTPEEEDDLDEVFS